MKLTFQKKEICCELNLIRFLNLLLIRIFHKISFKKYADNLFIKSS